MLMAIPGIGWECLLHAKLCLTAKMKHNTTIIISNYHDYKQYHITAKTIHVQGIVQMGQ